MTKIIIGYLIAAVFWFFMFSPWTAHLLNFWVMMLSATAVLSTYSFINGKSDLKRIYNFKFKWIAIGLIAAALLYALFYVGNDISRWIFSFTDRQVNNIYATKEQAEKWMIGLALLLWIGPSEEIFWRGYAQEKLSKIYGEKNALIINTLVYAIVHIWAFNFMLFMAALICGIFWGYMYYKYKNVWPALISHAVWDMMIFVIIPIS
jgi:membrane protease YdiL (CAAX protease family)